MSEIKTRGFIRTILAIATPVLGSLFTFKAIEYLPESEDSYKHKLRHALSYNTGGTVTHYNTKDGKRQLGMRCWTCGVILEGDEDPFSVEPENERKSRMYHKLW